MIIEVGDTFKTKPDAKWLSRNEIVTVAKIYEEGISYSYKNKGRYMVFYYISEHRFMKDTVPTTKTMLRRKLRRLD